LTIRAKNIIERVDVIIYADSLVSPEVCRFAREDAQIYKSASLTLEEITDIIINAVKQGKTVARLQSGDPSIYGAIGEQMTLLDEHAIEYEIIPGVSSLFAAAASLKAELTVPELTQTVIITRKEGRTPVPAAENLRSLAAHQAAIALFLSASLVEEVVSELIQGGYDSNTPATVVYKAGWKDELVIRTTLSDLTKRVRESGIKKQALILVGRFLNRQEKRGRSKLYDKDFKHGYR
jgi:precorrin-4/cobalt-precorrin-4 C11-methyltransferase